MRVSENRVLRRIYGPKRDEVTGEWRKLHNEGFHDPYSSPNIDRVIKSRSVYRFWWGNPGERDHSEDPGVDGINNIKMDLQEVGCGGMNWIWLRIGTSGGHL